MMRNVDAQSNRLEMTFYSTERDSHKKVIKLT